MGREKRDAAVIFRDTTLKILVSFPDGFAVMDDIKRDMPILATSGRDRADRTKRLAPRVADLDILSQSLVTRERGGWKITDKGRTVLEIMEARREVDVPIEVARADAVDAPVPPLPPLAERAKRTARASSRRTGERARSSAS